jgi:hypothetical protein
VSEDEETQKQGAVCVFWPQQRDFLDKLAWPFRQVLLHGAHRFSAFHICFSEEQHVAAVAAKTVLLAVPELRARCRIHIGTTSSCCYEIVSLHSIRIDSFDILGLFCS